MDLSALSATHTGSVRARGMSGGLSATGVSPGSTDWTLRTRMGASPVSAVRGPGAAIRCQGGVSARSTPLASSVRPATTGTTAHSPETHSDVAPVAAPLGQLSSLESATRAMGAASAEMAWRGTPARWCGTDTTWSRWHRGMWTPECLLSVGGGHEWLVTWLGSGSMRPLRLKSSYYVG